jgi:hypothetical protein
MKAEQKVVEILMKIGKEHQLFLKPVTASE